MAGQPNIPPHALQVDFILGHRDVLPGLHRLHCVRERDAHHLSRAGRVLVEARSAAKH